MRVILIADTPNWAFAKIANYISSQSRNEVEVIYSSQFSSYESLARFLSLSTFDVCHFFWRLYYTKFLEFIAASGDYDNLLNASFTVSVPDFAMLSHEYDEMNDLLSETTAGIVFTNRQLLDIYRLRHSYHGVERVIYDPLLTKPKREDVQEAICNKKSGLFNVAWVGNGNWKGAGHYSDYKGLHSILEPIVPILQSRGINVQIIDSARERISHKQVMDALLQSHVLCSTSMFEGTCLPVLEAMASGNAIITTNTGVFPELTAARASSSVVTRNSLAFLASILSLEADREEWERQANFNLKIIEDTEGLRSVDNWDSFFEDVIARSGASAKSVLKKRQLSIRTPDCGPTDAHGIVCITTSRWHGVGNSSKSLFGSIAAVPTPLGIGLQEFDGEALVSLLQEHHSRDSIVISGGDDFHRKLFEDNLDFFSSRHTTLLWHGSATQWQEDIHFAQFRFWNDQLTIGNIKGIAFLKKDMFEFFSRRGRAVMYVENWIAADLHGNNRFRTKSSIPTLRDKHPLRVGVLSAANHPLKNPTTQLLAAAAACNGKLQVVVPDKATFQNLAKAFNVEILSTGLGLTQAEHSRAMEICDVVLYATFTECSPLIPLEATQLGIPCIVSPAANIYGESEKLTEYLLVNRPDDMTEIKEKIERVIEDYPFVMAALREFYEEKTPKMRAMHEDYYSWCRGEQRGDSGPKRRISAIDKIVVG
jgi:glycosyltransferase involved in cell wall biosynthesis